ncbi:MAG TPA: family 43 glycosylhydrolase, partial [Nocardioides sp.]|nr:family 43 glycosylhydrolase [Nocardioides sp.]
APSYDVKAGSTVDADGPADHSAPRTVTVTAPGGATRAWTVRAVEMRSPVLPGLYADPNIAVFDGTYYIYATTDGVAGWGGKDFYVWKSTDLVDWERSAQPFLTLDGANGNVPWASGNAWAPTIIERGGKYYFYFSGHNPTYNRKTIGVAVADSPEGPFTAQPEAMILNNEAVTSGQAIDPAAFRDPATGKYYLFWGNGSPVYAELSDDMVSIKAETLGRITGLTSFREGSFVNYRQGTYHLTYSIDDTGSPDYRVGYATATSIDGPWTYRGVILQKDASQGILGTGHSSIVNVPGTDDWYVAYHRFALPTFSAPGGDGTHRETTIDRLTFGEDGLMQVVTPTLTSVEPLAEPEPTAPVATALPTVTGTAQVGRRLLAQPGTWDRSGLSFAHQWLRDGTPIAGAGSASYTPRAADVGHRLSVRVTATPATGPAGTATSTATRAVVKAGSTVRLRLSDSTPRARQSVVLRVTVGSTPAGVTAAGRVIVKVDGRQVAVPVLRSGVAAVTLRMARGTHTIAATYRGSSALAGDVAVLRVRVGR